MPRDIGNWQYPQTQSGNVPTPPPAGMESPGVYVTSGGVTAVEQTPFGLQATRISSIGTIAETPTVRVSAEAAKELHPEEHEVAAAIRTQAKEFEGMLPAGYSIALEKQGEGLILTGELKPGFRIEPGPPSYISAEPVAETLTPGYLEEKPIKTPAFDWGRISLVGGGRKPAVPSEGFFGGMYTSAFGKAPDMGKLFAKPEPSNLGKSLADFGFGKKEAGVSLASGLPEIGTRTLGLETAGFEFKTVKEAMPMMQTEAFRYPSGYEEKLSIVSAMKPKEDVAWKALSTDIKEGAKRLASSIFPKYEEEYKEGIIPFMPSGATMPMPRETVARGTWGAPAAMSLTAEEAVKSGAVWNLPKGIYAGFMKAPTVLSLAGGPEFGKYPGGAIGEFIGQMAFWKGMGEVFRVTAQTPAQTAYKEWIGKPAGRIKESMGVAETISGEKYPTYFETKFIVEPGEISKGHGIVSAISEIKGKTAVSLVPVSVISKTKEGTEVGISMAKAITEYNKEIITGTEAGRFISKALPSGTVLKLGEIPSEYRTLVIKPGSWGIAAETLSAEGKGGIVAGIAEQMPSDFDFGFTSGKRLFTQLVNRPSIATAGVTKAIAKNIGEIAKSISSERITKGALTLAGLSIVVPKIETGVGVSEGQSTLKLIAPVKNGNVFVAKIEPISQPFKKVEIKVTGGESFVDYPKWDIDTITKTFLTSHPPQESIAIPAQVISKPPEAAFSQIGKLYPPGLLKEEPKAKRVLTIPREQLEMSPLQRKMMEESGFAPRNFEFDWEKYAGGRVMGLQPKSGVAQFSKTGKDIMKQQKQYDKQQEKQRREQEKDYAQAGIGAGALKVISTTAQQHIVTPRTIGISTPTFEEMQQTGITPKVAQAEKISTDFEDYYPTTSVKTPAGFPPVKTIGFPKPSGSRRGGERQREDFYRKFEKESGMSGLKRMPFKEVDWGFRQWGSKVPVKRRREAPRKKGRKRR